ncbi:hypothetical protein IQ238_28670 [Pleurocapsales cyanobacterium LEGE 06147]|nr:hypothetical protein [Pleurocapsales cyanobacterium LEGE 06147]
METVTISQIEERLEKLSPERLQVVYDFVSYLAEREQGTIDLPIDSEAFQTMLASEAVLRREWDTPEEDAAWAHL